MCLGGGVCGGGGVCVEEEVCVWRRRFGLADEVNISIVFFLSCTLTLVCVSLLFSPMHFVVWFFNLWARC